MLLSLMLAMFSARAQGLPEPDSEAGTLCVAREWKMVGSTLVYAVGIDDVLLGELHGGHWLCARVEPGQWRVHVTADLPVGFKIIGYTTLPRGSALAVGLDWARATSRSEVVRGGELVLLEAGMTVDPGLLVPDNALSLDPREPTWIVETNMSPAKPQHVALPLTTVLRLPPQATEAERSAVFERQAADRVDVDIFDDED